jgi:hypothetical protein
MNFNLLLKFTDGTEKEVTGKASDIVAFEERFDISMQSLQKDVRVTHLMFLAWHSEKRTGATKDTFEKWVDTVDSIEAAEPKK